jgi:hypothetical protein
MDSPTPASAPSPQPAAPAPQAPPMQITIQPTHASHFLTVLSIIDAVLKAEQPLLLQVLPTPGKVGVVGGSVGLDAVIAALAASQGQ